MASEESVKQQRAKLEKLKAVRQGHRDMLTKHLRNGRNSSEPRIK